MSAAPGTGHAAHPAQRRIVTALSLSQVFSGVGNGSALAVGSVLAAELSGSAALGGTVTMCISAAGALSALPLARLALTRGRRAALTSAYAVAALGAVALVLAPALGSFAFLLLGAAGVGLGAAGNLQARFAATDLAAEGRRGRDLGIVVWSITLGAVAGPNLIGPGARLAQAVGLPGPSGAFLFSLAGMLAAIVVLQVGLRPDPLHARREAHVGPAPTAEAPRLRAGLQAAAADPRILLGVASVTTAHAVMVGVMSMTPVHLSHHAPGAAEGHAAGTDVLVLIGFVISLHIAGMYALSPLVGWAADRWGALTTVAAGFTVLLAAVCVGASGAGRTAAVAVALVLLGLGWSCVTVGGSAYVSAVAAGPRRVLVQGVTDAGMGAGGAVSAGGAGVLLSLLGYPGLNAVAGAVCAGLLAWVLVARRRFGERRYENNDDTVVISDNVTA